LKLNEGNRVDLTIEVEEKWTTIPYANLRGGGNTLYGYAGIYDINTFGKLIETGIQYDNWDGKGGGLTWFRNPRFLDKHMLIGTDIWYTTRPRTLYNTDGEIQGSYMLHRKKINLVLEREFNEWLNIGFNISVNQEEIKESESNNLIKPQTKKQIENDKRSKIISTQAYFQLGKLNYNNYIVYGKQSSLYLKYAGAETQSNENIKRILFQNSFFWRLPYQANAGLRVNAGAIETESIQHYFYIGGFENIRGYFDGQFRSKAYWQINAEYRIPSFVHEWLVLQHVFFIDAANAADRLSPLTDWENNVYSAGTGFRLISPRIYGFNGRMDIALFSSKKTKSYVSFGAQQFF